MASNYASEAVRRLRDQARAAEVSASPVGFQVEHGRGRFAVENTPGFGIHKVRQRWTLVTLTGHWSGAGAALDG